MVAYYFPGDDSEVLKRAQYDLRIDVLRDCIRLVFDRVDFSAMGNPWKDWATQISYCDQMQNRMSQIDFMGGEILSVSRERLPTLLDFIEQIV